MKLCASCLEPKQLTHRVTSDILNMRVCYECALRAHISQLCREPGVGHMTIVMVESPKVVPIFFDCFLCHDRCIGEHQYERHWYEKHG